MIDNQQVGRNLMLLRLQKGLSQQGLAEICNVTHQAVSKWENGAALPDVETVLFLSRFYGVTMEDILSGEISMDAEENEQLLPAVRESADGEERPEAQDGEPVLGWDEIIELAPFASRETLDRLVQKLLEEDRETPGWSRAHDLFPFVGRNTLEQLMDRCGGPENDPENEDDLFSFAPFVSAQYLEKAVRRIADKQGGISLETLHDIAPFLPKRMVDELILRYMAGGREKGSAEPQTDGEGEA